MSQLYDLPLDELRNYKQELTRQDDFGEFWEETKALLAKEPVEWDLVPVDYPADRVQVYELTYRGFGGALALAAAALSEIPRVAVAEYPYLSHFRRAIDIAPDGPYLEINEFFRRNSCPEIEEQAMKTLSYFDVMNLAPWILCPVLISIGLIDQITPPSTVFAAYNHIASQKEIRVYRYFGHEFIPAFHTEKLQFLRQNLKR